jgi:hypothetical protein
VFEHGIKVAFEHFGWISPDENPHYKTTSWNEREDDYSSVAFWYQTGVPTFQERAPHARERTLPSLERLTAYGRDFTAATNHGAGEGILQSLDLYPGPQLLYKPASAENAWLEISFDVKTKEPLRLLVNATKSYDFGKYEASLNGIKIGEVPDFYSEKTSSEEFHLLDFWPEPGHYTLRLSCVGKNYRSEGFFVGIESARLRERRPRVKDYAHEAAKDWRTNSVLYR